MSPLPNIVELAGIEGIRRKRVPSKITPADFFEDGEGVRRLFADLIHLSHPDHIALIPSVSYGMAIVARNVPVSKEQNIVVLSEQFPSNIYPWRRMWKEKGVEIKTVSPPEKTSGRAVGWNTKILEAINADTAIVAMGHVHWADGTLFDLEAIGSRARSVGAALVIDGTQSIGALPFDVNKIQPDVLICAGYKWLLGPYGIGLAYFGPRFHDGIPLEENWIGRLNSDQFSRLVQYEDRYQPGVKRFDVGERSNFILIPMMKSALNLIHSWGVDQIQSYCRDLGSSFIPDIQSSGFWVEDADRRGAHLFGIRVPDRLSVDEVRFSLEKYHISVSVRGNAIRVAPNVYNDKGDMDALKNVLLSL